MMSPTPNQAAAPVTVWLVEDNAFFRRGLVAVLGEAEGIRCGLAVGSCEEALEALAENPAPDLVLMDIGLPGMSGIEGTHEMRARAPQTRVLVLTAHEEDEKIFSAVCAGASGYLLKPSSGEEIVGSLHAVRAGAAPMNGYIARRVLDLFARHAVRPESEDPYGLSPREREILALLVEGWTMRQIAGRLEVSYHTVDTHLRKIYEKLHVHSRSHAVAKALREKLL